MINRRSFLRKSLCVAVCAAVAPTALTVQDRRPDEITRHALRALVKNLKANAEPILVLNPDYFTSPQIKNLKERDDIIFQSKLPETVTFRRPNVFQLRGRDDSQCA